MLEHMTLLNDTLNILNSAKTNDLYKELISNIGCIFEAHLPDLNEVFKRCNASSANEAAKEIRLRPIKGKNGETQTDNKVLSLFKNVDGDLSQRLVQFSFFCLNNKKAINALLKKKSSVGIQISDIVKYMPNLLDFESKREYFKREMIRLQQNQ